jgi:2-polyprenyl-3-methyl-5-hydroxy-6-metoxy-1,4-benzoquinol methylase
MKFSQQKLEDIASNSLYTTFTNSATILYSYEIFRRFLRPGKVLELGPAEGLMTEQLLNSYDQVTIVEGSKTFCVQLNDQFGSRVNISQCLFEDFKPIEKFDNIILGHVLEHVEDPEKILELARNWLSPDGILLSAVPNARSIHRQAAVKMGLLKSIFELSPKDIHHGHLRIYTPETFESAFLKSSYSLISKGGYWLKPLSDRQIEENWTREMLLAFMQLGEFYPDIAAELYIVAKAENQ